MIAEIIPIKRLPKKFNVFDYTIPAELESRLKIGQLVIIPIRKSKIYGLVLSVKEKNSLGKLKDIHQIVHDEPIVDKNYLDYIMELSELYGISAGTIIKMGLLPLQSRKLKTINLIKIEAKNKKAEDAKPYFFHYKNHTEHGEILKENTKKNTLILVPEIKLTEEVFELLPKELQDKAIIWHSRLSTKQQFEKWLQIRNNEKQIIIGTRGAVFLPFYNLDKIIIDYEHEENHKHWDQLPRFHAKDAVQIIAEKHGADIVLTSFTPSCESYFNIHKNNYITPAKENIFNISAQTDNVNIVDMADERRAGRYEIFADAVKEKLLQVKKDVFIFINQTGSANFVGCQNCDFSARCAACNQPMVFHEKTNTLNCHFCHTKIDMPKACPKCANPIIKIKGLGTESIETEIKKIFKSKNEHDIIRIDSETGEMPVRSEKPAIIVGTSMAIPLLDWKNIQLIVFANIDKQFNIPEYLALENAWHLIWEVLYRKNIETEFMIQTFKPAHLIFKSLKEPDRFYRTELNSRQKLSYPPYVYLARYFYGNEDQNTSKTEAEKVHYILGKILTKDEKKTMITYPIEMNPKYYRRQFWQVIIVKIGSKDWREKIKYINKYIPDNWKIDPNPISILSP